MHFIRKDSYGPWIFHENLSQSISWAMKPWGAKWLHGALICHESHQGIFHGSWKGSDGRSSHAFYTKRQLWALNFPWKLVTEYFMGHETMGSEMTSWGINLSWIPSRYISWVMKRFWWSFQRPWMWLGLYPSVSWAINYPETPYMIFKLAHGS